jgi:predicted ribonuclease toxin of YeeF-YezG toxin-antitoxin module
MAVILKASNSHFTVSIAEYKAENPDEDISEEDYRTAEVNTWAFEYESIEDDQFTKELWINIAALVVTVAVTVVCPPAGFVLGAAYAGAEMGSAISGKDWASGRELDTSERWLRGIAAPVDILPVGKAATTFTGTARTTNKVVDLGSALNKTKLRSSLAGVTAHQTSKVKQLVETAGQQTSSRLRNASHSVKNSTSVLKNKLGEEAIKVAQKGDAGITKVLHMFPQANLATDNGIMFASPGNFNKLEAGTAKVVDRLGAVSKGTDNGNKVNKVKEIDFGKHIIKGENGKKQLLPNTKYVTNDNYKYNTDELGRIVNVDAPELVLKKANRNKYAQANVGGKDRLLDDDGGHLIGAQFNGPPDIDNLVPQNSQINRRGGVWYEMETEWANALKEVPPKKVSVSIEPIYSNNSMRPDSFMIEYEIEGQFPVIREIANKSGG